MHGRDNNNKTKFPEKKVTEHFESTIFKKVYLSQSNKKNLTFQKLKVEKRKNKIL